MSAWWPTAAEPDAEEAIRVGFPGWKITRDGLAWSAFWRSDDGRHCRYVAAQTATELLGKLRAIGDLSVPEVAALFGVHQATVLRWMRTRVLSFTTTRTGERRVQGSEVRDLLAPGEHAGVEDR